MKKARIKISKSRLGLKNSNAKKCKIVTPDNKVYITCVNEFIKLYGKQYKVVPHFLRNLLNSHKKKDGWKLKYIK